MMTPSEVFSYEDLRLIANAVRRYRTVIERKAQQRGQPPSNVEQLDRIERIMLGSLLPRRVTSMLSPRAVTHLMAQVGKPGKFRSAFRPNASLTIRN